MATSFVTWAESLSTPKDRIWLKTYFFIFYLWSSRNFGPKTGLILSEDLFFWSSLFLNFLAPPSENPAYVTVSHLPHSPLMQPVESCYTANFYATF